MYRSFLYLVLLSSVMFFFNATAQAAVRRYCLVKYETEYGWSKTYRMEVTFMTGFELNQATKSINYDTYVKYGLLWFGDGEVAILKITDYIMTGSQFHREDFRNAFLQRSELDCRQVNDEEETRWKIIGKDFMSFVNPRKY